MKVFRKDLYMKDFMERNKMTEEEFMDELKWKRARSIDGKTWIDFCDGERVKNGSCNGFIISDDWCEEVEDEEKSEFEKGVDACWYVVMKSLQAQSDIHHKDDVEHAEWFDREVLNYMKYSEEFFKKLAKGVNPIQVLADSIAHFLDGFTGGDEK